MMDESAQAPLADGDYVEPLMIPAIAADGTLFPMEKLEAHRKAQFHLAVSIFVFDGDELLLQRRARSKYHCGGLWANSCCTHPHWGESVSACAARRLPEELGFSLPVQEHRVIEYSAAMNNGLHEHERVHMFSAQADKASLLIKPVAAEVDDVRWVTAPALRTDMEANPCQYTPWFRIYVERFPELKF